ncbi:MAG: formylglycine-generating enzyme family protein [Verrucomicrobiales bacterium]
MRSTSAAPDDPDAWPLTLPGDIPMVFRRIPAGEFWMGSRGGETDEAPRHRVRIDRAFWLGETPVTRAQYAAAGLGNPSHFSDHPDHPVADVSWLDAVGYADWLTNTLKETFPPGVSLACLPTEAEWEYACRGGTETDYWSGDGEAALAEVGWYGEDWDSGSTHPVRAKQRPNSFGLHDLHGNVWEWCHDLWAAQAYRDHWDGIPDPGAQRRATDYQTMNVLNSDQSSDRVLRGGSGYGSAWRCRSAIRVRFRAGNRDWDDGFRLCLLPGPVAASPDQKEAESGDGGGRRGTRRKPEERDGAGPDLDLARERLPERPA